VFDADVGHPFEDVVGHRNVVLELSAGLVGVDEFGGREVEDDVDLCSDRLGDDAGIGTVACDELGLTGHPLPATVRAVVDDHDVVVGHEPVGEVRTDESGPARDDHALSRQVHTRTSTSATKCLPVGRRGLPITTAGR